MAQPRIEKVGEAIRVRYTCDVCWVEVVWEHIELGDDGRFLTGTCRCKGRQHRYALDPTDKVVVDEKGSPV
jgi:hypothetical protein